MKRKRHHNVENSTEMLTGNNYLADIEGTKRTEKSVENKDYYPYEVDSEDHCESPFLA